MCVCVCMYVCMYVYICVCLRICVCMYNNNNNNNNNNLLSQVSFPWYFSGTIDISHYSGFEFQIVALSVLCALSLVQLFWFCRESIECVPGIVSGYFVSPLVTIPVVPMITGMTKHFVFNIFIFWFLFSLLLYYIPIRCYCYAYRWSRFMSCF
jgi:hypothetical protein